MPDKFKNSSAEEIARAYTELESQRGKDMGRLQSLEEKFETFVPQTPTDTAPTVPNEPGADPTTAWNTVLSG